MNARLLAPLALLLLAGCGGGSQSAHVDPVPDLVGTWRGTYTHTSGGTVADTGSAVIVVTPLGVLREYRATLTPSASGDTVVIHYIGDNPQYDFWIGNTPGSENVVGKNGLSFTVNLPAGGTPELVASMYYRNGLDHYRAITHKE